MNYTETKKQIGFYNLMAVGAQRFVGGPNYLEFAVKIVCNRFDLMRITLDPSDTYTLSLWVKGKLKKSVSGLYCDQIGEAVYQMGTRS